MKVTRMLVVLLTGKKSLILVSLKVFRTKIRYFSIHKRSRIPFKVNKKVYLYLKHDQSREQQYHGTNKSFQLKFSASHS